MDVFTKEHANLVMAYMLTAQMDVFTKEHANIVMAYMLTAIWMSLLRNMPI